MTARDEILAYLGAHDIPYRLVSHAPVQSMGDCEALVAKPYGVFMPKNILLAPRNLSQYHLFITHPALPFKSSVISKALNASRLSFADSDAPERLLKTVPGAISPLGLIFGGNVRLAIERTVLTHSDLAFHPNAPDSSVLLKTEDFLCAFLPRLGISPTIVDGQTDRT